MAVLMVYPTDGEPPDWGKEELESIFIEHKYSPKSFFDENSKGKLNLSGQFFGWRKLSKSSDDYYYEDSGDWANGNIIYDAINLFDDKVDYKEFDVVFLIFSHKNYYDVMASGNTFSTNEGEKYLGVVFSGRTLYEGYGGEDEKFISSDRMIQQICFHLTHELGHTLGLNHAMRWVPYSVEGCQSCSNLKKPEDSSDCKITAYGGWDVMGSHYFNFPFFTKVKLGWLDEGEVIEVKKSQTLRLKQRNADFGDRYAWIPVGLNDEGKMAYVTMEYLSDTGIFDSHISGYVKDPRVLLICYYPNGQWIDKNDGRGGGDYLTYMQVEDGKEWDTSESIPIFSGSRTSWCDPKRGLTIEVKEETGDTAEEAQVEVEVTLDCPEVPYYVSATMETGSNGTQTVHAGDSLDIPLTLTTKDVISTELDCDPMAYSFSFGVNAPDGWNVQLSSWNASLKSGESAATNLSISVPYGTEAGDYEVTVKATDDSDYLNAEVKIPVMVTVIPNYTLYVSCKSEVQRGKDIKITAYVVDDAVGRRIGRDAEITCKITKSDGSEEEKKFDKNWAVLYYSIKNSDPVGEYTAKIKASVAAGDYVDQWSSEEKELKFKVKKKLKNAKKQKKGKSSIDEDTKEQGSE